MFLGVKSGRCVGLTTLPPSCADCLEILKPQPSENLKACPDLYWDCFTFLLVLFKILININNRTQGIIGYEDKLGGNINVRYTFNGLGGRRG
jgi:hypothetical protein